MQVQFSCECGQVMTAEVGPGGGTAQCPSCGQVLAVQAPPTYAPGSYAPAERQSASGKAVASLVFGLCSYVPGVGVICAPLGVGLGIATLVKKLRGRGLAIAGIATGATGLLIVQTIVALTVWTMVVTIRQATQMMSAIAMPPTVTYVDTSDEGLTAALTQDLIAGADANSAEADLARAKALFVVRDTKPGGRYECFKHFRTHLAKRGSEALADAKDAGMYQTVLDELVQKVRGKLDEGDRLQTQGKWAQAEKAYAEVLDLVPDTSSTIHQSATERRDTAALLRGAAPPSVVEEPNDVRAEEF